ncbi:MAG: hypothetical protein RLP44_08805 [Aggregatilineales bacterium]
MAIFKFRKRLLLIWFAGLTLLIGWGSSAQPNSVFNHICSGVCDLAWSPDGNVLAAVNRFGLWLYNVDEDDAPRLYPYENVSSVDFSSDGEQIAITSCSPAISSNRTCRGAISLFDLNTKIFEEILATGHQTEVRSEENRNGIIKDESSF